MVFTKKNSRRILNIIIPFFLILILLTMVSPKTTAIEAEVTATLDEHSIDHLLSTNSTNNIYVSGNVTCKIEGLGGNIQRVEVDLWGSCQKWDCGVGPTHMTFTSNGKKSFNLTISIPITAKNNTQDTFSVGGHWQTHPYQSYVIGGSDDVIPDSVNVTVRRKGYVHGPRTTTPEYEELEPWWEEIGLQNLAVLILIFAIIIIAIVFYFHRRKVLKEILEEENKR